MFGSMELQALNPDGRGRAARLGDVEVTAMRGMLKGSEPGHCIEVVTQFHPDEKA